MNYMQPFDGKSLHTGRAGLILLAAALTGCASNSTWLASDGPQTSTVAAQGKTVVPIRVLDVDAAMAAKVSGSHQPRLFSEAFGVNVPADLLIGAGDVLEVAIWEAPPAVLFGSASAEGRGVLPANRSMALPEQMVAVDGTISVPFAGQVKAAGRTPQQVASEITRRLREKAHLPQVLVRMVQIGRASCRERV